MFDFASFTPAVWDVIKVFVLILMGLYIIFATVIVRQVNLMTHTLSLGLESTIKLVAWLHLAFSIVVLLAALFYL